MISNGKYEPFERKVLKAKECIVYEPPSYFWNLNIRESEVVS
jgi:hypothetical protein